MFNANRLKKWLVLALFVTGAIAQAGPLTFTTANGDGACPAGSTVVTPDVTHSYKAAACQAIGSAASARLADGGAMRNAAAGCQVLGKDAAVQPVTLCESITFELTNGDNNCPANMRLASVKEAALFNRQACAVLQADQWYIARLADGGAINGAGYGCTVTGEQPKPLGNSLCTSVANPSK